MKEIFKANLGNGKTLAILTWNNVTPFRVVKINNTTKEQVGSSYYAYGFEEALSYAISVLEEHKEDIELFTKNKIKNQ